MVPIDKSSTVLTILLAFLLLGEPIGLSQGIGAILIGVGTLLMIEPKHVPSTSSFSSKGWMGYAFGSAIFASLTAILGKMGIEGVESNLGTAIRTGVVLVMAWVMVLVMGKTGRVRGVPRGELGFICLPGLATGASWVCYYRAVQEGVLFSLRHCLDQMEEQAGEPRRIFLSGGILQSPGWTQMCADILGRELELAAVAQASMTGAAVTARWALGKLHSLEEYRPAAGGTAAPNPAMEAYYREKYKRYRDAYQRTGVR